MVLEPVIASLDQNALRDCLQNLTEKDKLPYAVTAFAMICTEEQMKKLRNNSQLKYVAAGATLNKGEFAFEYSSKDSYMQLNGISKQDYLETTMTDLGFNEEGEILFDLGTSVVAAILRPDLGVDLQDRTSGKPLKSLPKDGIDKTEVSFAERTLKNLKKEIREFLAERRKVLLLDSLSAWKESRNSKMHALMKGSHSTQELAALAQEGKTLARALCTGAGKYKRAVERREKKREAWVSQKSFDSGKKPDIFRTAPLCPAGRAGTLPS